MSHGRGGHGSWLFLMALGNACGGDARHRPSSVDRAAGAAEISPMEEASGSPDAAGEGGPTVADGATGETHVCNPLSDWERTDDVNDAARTRSVPRVEVHAATARGEELLIVGDGSLDDRNLRVFFGIGGHLVEQRVVDLQRAYDGYVPYLSFSLQVQSELATVSVMALHPETRDTDPRGGGTLVIGGSSSALDAHSRTRLALAGLTFECTQAALNGWRLSNDPPSHAPVPSCPSALPTSFSCFMLGEGAPGSDEFLSQTEFNATVLEKGTGLPPTEACREEAEFALRTYPNQSLVWALLAHEEGERVIVLDSPGVHLPLAVGDELEVFHEYNAYQEGEAITLRRDSGELLLWVGGGYTLESVRTPPELSLAHGAEQCAMPIGCYSTSLYALQATLAGTTMVVDYGQQTERGGFLIVHRGNDIPTAQAIDCFDGASARMRAELWALPTDGAEP